MSWLPSFRAISRTLRAVAADEHVGHLPLDRKARAARFGVNATCALQLAAGCARDLLAIVEGQLAKGQLHFAEAHRRNADGVHPEPHEHPSAVRVSGHLAANGYLDAPRMAARDDLPDHAPH